MKRRCGWLPTEATAHIGLVWARRNVVLDTCPTSYVTAESQSLIEEFFIRRRLRALDGENLSARQVEAFVILEKELAKETDHGRQDFRHSP